MIRFKLVLAVAVTALAVVASTSAAPTATKLVGTVGPSFTITLKKNGTMVKKLPHGTYTIVVTDKSQFHNFVLKGPGLNKVITGVSFKGTKTVTLKLKPGSYTYVCTPHASLMHHSFKVT